MIYFIRHFFILFFCLALLFGLCPNISDAAGNVTGQAWSSTIGWVNFGATYGNVQVTDSSVTGQAWNANYGWINLAPTQSGVNNNGAGQLSGWGWGANLGWVNFSGVTIDSDGQFTGTATGDNSGDITFDCTYCHVVTTWRPTGAVAQNADGSERYIQTSDETSNEDTSDTTTEDAIIAQLWAQIQSLTEQINILLVQRQGQTGSLSSILTEPLFYGSTGSQVVLLQDILKQQGFFPKEVNSNGKFGPTTLKAVQDFQVKYSIASLSDPGFGFVGPKTRAALNQLAK